MNALWRFAPLLISALLPAGLCGASLAEVKSVYLFPMSNGLDQYLADRITHDHIFQVVTDPKAADAIITDRIGESFQRELYTARPELKPVPPPKPHKTKRKSARHQDNERHGSKAAAKNKDADEDEDAADDEDADKDEEAMITPESSFHAGKGTIFLVHAKSQQVVWSAYEHSANHTPKDMEKTARRIAKQLEKDLAPPPEKK